jgi:diacylglycerol kinase
LEKEAEGVEMIYLMGVIVYLLIGMIIITAGEKLAVNDPHSKKTLDDIKYMKVGMGTLAIMISYLFAAVIVVPIVIFNFMVLGFIKFLGLLRG